MFITARQNPLEATTKPETPHWYMFMCSWINYSVTSGCRFRFWFMVVIRSENALTKITLESYHVTSADRIEIVNRINERELSISFQAE